MWIDLQMAFFIVLLLLILVICIIVLINDHHPFFINTIVIHMLLFLKIMIQMIMQKAPVRTFIGRLKYLNMILGLLLIGQI